jgi:hypothetical protein
LLGDLDPTNPLKWLRFGCFWWFPWEGVTPVFPNKTNCITICMPGSSFMHIVTYKWIQKQYHVGKRKIIRDLRFILETKAPNITGSRLRVAYT